MKNTDLMIYIRECVSTGAAVAQTCRSLGHQLLHPLILRRLVICSPADCENPENRLHPQIQIPNAFPVYGKIILLKKDVLLVKNLNCQNQQVWRFFCETLAPWDTV